MRTRGQPWRRSRGQAGGAHGIVRSVQRANHLRPQIARLTKGAKPSFLTGVIGLMATLAMHAGRPDPEEEKRQSVHIVAPDGAAAAANAIPRVPVEQRPNMALFVRVPQQAMNVFLVRCVAQRRQCPCPPGGR